MEMTDYAELADIARARHEAEQHLAVTPLGLKADPKAYFDKVKTLIFTEMNKANVELHLKSMREEISSWLSSAVLRMD